MPHSENISAYVNNNRQIFIWIFFKKKKENQSAEELNIDVEDNLAVIMFFNYSGVSEYFKISFRKLFEI